MQKVISSTIAEVGYGLGTLTIKFKNGTAYGYNDVPEKVYKDLLIAKSKGKYFAANIKNKYYTMKMGSPVTKGELLAGEGREE